jgi:hypothetical protein
MTNTGVFFTQSYYRRSLKLPQKKEVTIGELPPKNYCSRTIEKFMSKDNCLQSNNCWWRLLTKNNTPFKKSPRVITIRKLLVHTTREGATIEELRSKNYC